MPLTPEQERRRQELLAKASGQSSLTPEQEERRQELLAKRDAALQPPPDSNIMDKVNAFGIGSSEGNIFGNAAEKLVGKGYAAAQSAADLFRDKQNQKSFGEYEQQYKDLAQGNKDWAQKKAPLSYGAGALTGMAASAGSLPSVGLSEEGAAAIMPQAAAKIAAPVSRVLGNAAQSYALEGLSGEGPELFNTTKAKQAATSTGLLTAGLEAISPTASFIANRLGSVGKYIPKMLGGPNAEKISEYVSRWEPIQKLGAEEAMATKVPHDISQEIQSALERSRKDISQASSNLFGLAEKSGEKIPRELLENKLAAEQAKFVQNGTLPLVGSQDHKAFTLLDGLQKDIKRYPEMLDAKQAKALMDQVYDVAKNAGSYEAKVAGQFTDKGARALKRAAGGFRQDLGAKIPGYNEAAAGIPEKIGANEDVMKYFGNDQRAIRNIKRVANDSHPSAIDAMQALQNFDLVNGTQLSRKMKDLNTLKAMTGPGKQQGSAYVNMGALGGRAAGAISGAMLGHQYSGDDSGWGATALGGLAGLAAPHASPKAAKAVIDVIKTVPMWLNKIQAAQRMGPAAVTATHLMLMNTDPSYKKQMSRLQKRYTPTSSEEGNAKVMP